MKCTEFDAAIAARHGNLARVDATVKDDVAMTLCQAILRITHRLMPPELSGLAQRDNVGDFTAWAGFKCLN